MDEETEIPAFMAADGVDVSRDGLMNFTTGTDSGPVDPAVTHLDAEPEVVDGWDGHVDATVRTPGALVVRTPDQGPAVGVPLLVPRAGLYRVRRYRRGAEAARAGGVVLTEPLETHWLVSWPVAEPG